MGVREGEREKGRNERERRGCVKVSFFVFSSQVFFFFPSFSFSLSLSLPLRSLKKTTNAPPD
jgi:hypothetical protein